MQKTYVLDTNVLIQSPRALLSFEDNRIVLPLAVLEELDALKTADGERGANARASIRMLEALRLEGSLTEGVPLPSGGSLRVEVNCVDVALPQGFPDHKNDNRILKVCLGLAEREAPLILVTKDILVRIKAQMLNIEAEDYITEQAPARAWRSRSCQINFSSCAQTNPTEKHSWRASTGARSCRWRSRKNIPTA